MENEELLPYSRKIKIKNLTTIPQESPSFDALHQSPKSIFILICSSFLTNLLYNIVILNNSILIA